jgi:stage V sporulation protein AE
LVSGIVLETIGVYEILFNVFNAGVSVPIVGFGAALAKGAIEWAHKVGFLGAFAGGLINTGFGVGVAIVASYLVTLIFSPKSKS